MKYPLLLRQVLKFSNANNEFAADMTILESAIENLENVLKDVDNAMAQARANFTVSRLEWLDEGVEARSSSIVANAEEEIISGTLRNNRGTVKNDIIIFSLNSSCPRNLRHFGNGQKKCAHIFQVPITFLELY